MRQLFQTVISCFVLFLSISSVGAQTMETDSWKSIKALIDEQKFQEALGQVEKILTKSQAEKDDEQWTRALIAQTQLNIGLSSYEAAVKKMKSSSWPEEHLYQSILKLYYVHSLVSYFQAYSWEILKREQVYQKAELDLKQWTQGDLVREIEKSFKDVMSYKAEIGGESADILKDYLTKGDYPTGIRDTIADLMVYEQVEFWRNSGFWSVAEANEKYLLNLKKLLGTESIGVATHPLEKAAFLLQEHERWHLSANHLDAALEARRVLDSLLYSNFNANEDRLLIIANLEEQIKFRKTSVWAPYVIADLAEMILGTEDSGQGKQNLRAYDLVKDCETKYPLGVGLDRCFNVKDRITQSDYEISGMQVDGIGEKSIRLKYKNLTKLYWRAYRVDLEDRLRMSGVTRTLPDTDEFYKIVQNRTPEFSWTLDLQPTPDYQWRNQDVIPPIDKKGHYIVVSSASENFFEREHNEVHGLQITVSDYVLQRRVENDGIWKVRILNGHTGEPAPDVTVSVYRQDWKTGIERVELHRTDSDGLAEVSPVGKNQSQAHFLVASKEGDVVIDESVISFYRMLNQSSSERALVYTDRSFYRPGQKVQWKVMVYDGDSSIDSYHVKANEKVDVILFDYNHQKIKTLNVTTNEFGSASGEFLLPAGKALGVWNLRVDKGQTIGSTSVHIEEYVRPTFEVKVDSEGSAFKLNKPAQVKIKANYFFGQPLSNGQVKWKVERSRFFPSWFFCWFCNRDVQKQIVASGKSQMSGDGTVTIEFTPQADTRNLEEISKIFYNYIVSADVTDDGGETRSVTRSLMIGSSGVTAQIDAVKNFFVEDEKVKFSIKRMNLASEPIKGEGNVKVFKLIVPDKIPLPSEMKDESAYVTRWKNSFEPMQALAQFKEGDVVSQHKLNHDESGLGELSLSGLKVGSYRLVYETKDADGTLVSNKKDFIVWGESLNLGLAAILLPEKNSISVGEKLRVLVNSGYDKQPFYFESSRRNLLYSKSWYQAQPNLKLVEIPITEELRGGFVLSQQVLRKFESIQLKQTVDVPWENKHLTIKWSHFNDHLRPQAKERWVATIKSDSSKNKLGSSTEVLAYMYDKSLDSFAEHSSPTSDSIYQRITSGVLPFDAGLGAATRLYFSGFTGFSNSVSAKMFQPQQLVFFDNWGIGGPGARGGMYFGGKTDSLMMKSMAAVPTGGTPEAISSNSLSKEKSSVPNDSDLSSSLRTDFQETAFWKPHLLLNKNQEVAVEFQVPDSVTTWKYWLHAFTKDMLVGEMSGDVVSSKDVMARLYLPRFFREGDEGEIRLVINNTTQKMIKADTQIEIIDPDTHKNLMSSLGIKEKIFKKNLQIEGGKSESLILPLKIPAGLGSIAVRAQSTSGNFTDGEERSLPILPGRLHLAQSRFVTLKDNKMKQVSFTDMSESDASRVNEKMVITIDADIFQSMLRALPSLMSCESESVDLISGRYLVTGILGQLYKEFPSVAKSAQKTSADRTQLWDSWNIKDPNLKMRIDETPWVMESKGGLDKNEKLISLLQPELVKSYHEKLQKKLVEFQTSSGGFAWYSGGAPSPFMTLIVLSHLSRALEFGADIPKDMFVAAWKYLQKEIGNEKLDKQPLPLLVTANYVASSIKNDELREAILSKELRGKILEFCFSQWKNLSPYMKAMLALTLNRDHRTQDAQMVFNSIMDSAKTTEDEGTYWAAEDRSWLWYNDTIETHAFILRAMMEMNPEDSRREGLVQWIFINKKLNQWKSAHATSEVLYTLAYYLKHEKILDLKQKILVQVGEKKKTFLSDETQGRSQNWLITGKEIKPTMSTIKFEKDSAKGLALASATWHFSTEKWPTISAGDFFSVKRTYFLRAEENKQMVLRPLSEGTSLHVGDEVEVHLSISGKHEASYIHLRDPRASGFEPGVAVSGWKWDLGIGYYEEVRDSGTNFYFEYLPVGEFTLKYRMKVTSRGVFRSAPSVLQSIYAPEFVGYSSGELVRVQ